MHNLDVDRFQSAFNRVCSQRERLRFEKQHELVEDLAIVLEVVYAGFRQSEALNSTLTQILKGIQTMAGELETLKAQVASSISVQESAIQLLDGLKVALDTAIAKNNAGDPTALAELSTTLGAEQTKLAAAVVANTPAAPPPVPVPEPAPGTSTAPAPAGTGGGQPATEPVPGA